MTQPAPDLPAASSQPPARSRLWIGMMGVTLCVIAAAAVALFVLREDEAGIPAIRLDLGAVVAANGEPQGTVNLRLSPAQDGNNRIEVEVQPSDDSILVAVERVDVTFAPLVPDGEEQFARIDLSSNPWQGAGEVTLAGAPMWQATILDQTTEQGTLLATFFLMVPDPNLHGNETIPLPENDPEAGRLYEQASTQIAALHRVTYAQGLSDGLGLAVLSHHAINDGADGSNPGFTYVNPGGFEAVVIDETAWSRSPGEAWEVRDTNRMIPPSEWGGEFTGATGFQMGPVAETPAGSCRTITFVVPEEAKRSIAWYAWCIDEATGDLFRDAMISRNHYMVTSFNDFNGDVVVEPPILVEAAAGHRSLDYRGNVKTGLDIN